LEELDQMPAAEYVEWARYYNDEPFGEVRADLRAGIIASTVANAMRGKGGRARKPMEFMPIVRKQQEQDVPQVAMLRQAFETSIGGKVKHLKIRRN
jgi:hypothetical protein